MRKLHLLGTQYGTDKVDNLHTFRDLSYLDVYQIYFRGIRCDVRCLLELGVFKGRSLQVWRDYFPNAQIWGLDLDPQAKADYGPRIQVVTGSQIDPNALSLVAPDQLFDVVIDDASHVIDHQIASYLLLWPRVKPGGFYIIEDLQVSHWGDISNSWREWPGQKHNPPETTDFKLDRSKLDRFFADQLKIMDLHQGDIRFLHFWSKQAIFCKV
jgi:hypothetical protein